MKLYIFVDRSGLRHDRGSGGTGAVAVRWRGSVRVLERREESDRHRLYREGERIDRRIPDRNSRLNGRYGRGGYNEVRPEERDRR